MKDFSASGINVKILFVGHEKCDPLHSFGPTLRVCTLIHYVISGKGILRTSYATYSLTAGCSFFIFPGEITYYEADKDDPWEYYWIAIDDKYMDVFNENITKDFVKEGINSVNPIYYNHHKNDFDKIYKKLFRITEKKPFLYDMKIVSSFFELLYFYNKYDNEYIDDSVKL